MAERIERVERPSARIVVVDDDHFGEDTGRNPRSCLHPEQGPPPDLDDAPPHHPVER